MKLSGRMAGQKNRPRRIFNRVSLSTLITGD